MTTSYDHRYGLESPVKTIDAWCPLTPRLDPTKAARARAEGKRVWWSICCGPHNPHANWFVEYAAIESRLLMGAITAKQRPDGFLYYSLTIWNQPPFAVGVDVGEAWLAETSGQFDWPGVVRSKRDDVAPLITGPFDDQLVRYRHLGVASLPVCGREGDVVDASADRAPVAMLVTGGKGASPPSPEPLTGV